MQKFQLYLSVFCSLCERNLLLTIDKDASDESKKDVPVEAGIVHRLAMVGLNRAPSKSVVVIVICSYQENHRHG